MRYKCKKLKNKMKKIIKKLNKQRLKSLLCSNNSNRFNSSCKPNSNSFMLSNKDSNRLNNKRAQLPFRFNKCNNSLNSKKLKWMLKKKDQKPNFKHHKNLLIKLMIQTELGMLQKLILVILNCNLNLVSNSQDMEGSLKDMLNHMVNKVIIHNNNQI